MNIFVLDEDPIKAAQMHADKHVVKMILESAQMMCTVCHELGMDVAYKPSHKNHPCTKWSMKSKSNWNWLKSLADNLNKEWQYRYGHTRNHKSWDVVCNLDPDIPDIGLTPFALAMPEKYQSLDAVESYRQYYIGEKSNILKYTKRKVPHWIPRKNIS
jgi:hypothetical protein